MVSAADSQHSRAVRLEGHDLKRLLSWSVCAGLLTLESLAQAVPAAEFLNRSSASKTVAAPASRASFLLAGATPQQDQTQTAEPQGSDHGFVALIKRGARDQKEIYSAPFHRQNLKWDALFLAATAGLIAADKHVTGAISHDNLNTSLHISDIGLYSSIAVTGGLLVSGVAKKDEHALESGLLGFEALANTLAVSAVTQLIAGRERPLEGAGNGRFWVNNNVDSSFPSMHSSLTWSLMSVLAHEYPRPWVEVLGYGTATAVSVTRVTGLKHFPADVAVGGVFGYFIGQHIFHAHSRFYRTHHK